ncbi:MAG: hypothetical protein L0221_13350, partial [Chloroflexi bacterium]|nr:hypothetical protein [Chloroflexota bacterium]
PADIVARLFATSGSGTVTIEQCINVGTGQWDCQSRNTVPNVNVRVVEEGEAFRIEDFDFL